MILSCFQRMFNWVHTASYLSDFPSKSMFTRILGGVDGSGKSLWVVVSFSFNNMLLGVTGGKYKDIRLGPRFFPRGQKVGCGGRTNGRLLLTRPQGTHCKDLLSASPTDFLPSWCLALPDLWHLAIPLSCDLFDLPQKFLCSSAVAGSLKSKWKQNHGNDCSWLSVRNSACKYYLKSK